MNDEMLKQQKTAFIGTVWPGHVGLDKDECTDDEFMLAGEDWFNNLDIPGLTYVYAQFEVGKTGALHMQVALKLSKVSRARTLMNRYSGSWQPALNPEAVFDYCEKTEGRVKALEPRGKRPRSVSKRTDGHGTLKQIAISLLGEGRTPTQIAVACPEAYFQHHRAIHALHERYQESPEFRPKLITRRDDQPLDGEATEEDEGTGPEV